MKLIFSDEYLIQSIKKVRPVYAYGFYGPYNYYGFVHHVSRFVSVSA